MNHIVVNFLGNEYNFPYELIDYIPHLQFFNRFNDEVMRLLENQITKGEYSGGAETDFDYFTKPLLKLCKRIISKLSSYGVYDVTIQDLLYNNQGYIELHQICSNTIQEMTNILKGAMSEWLTGQENAYSSALSNITGSGVSILTNDPITAMLYSANETSVIKRQSNAADIQYRRDMKSLSGRINSNQQQQENNLLNNYYYPQAQLSLELFVSVIQEIYYSKLEQAGVFAYSTVSPYDTIRSSDLLSNLSLVSDKQRLLTEAFLCCPYNSEVYQRVIEYNLSDIPTLEAAKQFGQDEILIPVLDSFIQSNLYDVDIVAAPIAALALFQEVEEGQLWDSYYSFLIEKFNVHYNQLNSIVNDRSKLVDWIKRNLTKDASILVNMQQNVIERKVTNAVTKRVISESVYALFLQWNIVQTDLQFDNIDTLDNWNNEYIKVITDCINKLIEELRTTVNALKDDITKAKREYDTAEKKYSAEYQELEKKRFYLIMEREKLSDISFLRKRKLTLEIEKYDNLIDSLKSQSQVDELRERYEQLKSKMHELF